MNSLRMFKTILETKTVAPITLSSTTIQTTIIITTTTKTDTTETKPKTVYQPCEPCGKTNQSTEKCYCGANAANRPFPRQRIPQR